MIEKNPSRRNLAKLCANSLWGKMVQRPINQGVQIFSDLDSFQNFISNEGIEIVNIIACEDKALVSWKFLNSDDTELTGQSAYESVTTGVYTTALARMKLYEEMEQIESDCLLYCDTDSIVFVERPNARYTPKIGTCIGELTDEIADRFGTGAYISEFVSTAPKTYALKVRFSDQDNTAAAAAAQDCIEIVKCKGYTANNVNSLSFAKVKALLEQEEEEEVDDDDDSPAAAAGGAITTENK